MRGGNKNLFLTTLLLMFVLFLSMISVVFGLKGNLFVFEILALIALLVFAAILIKDMLKCKKWAWPGMLIFFSLNLINELLLLIKTNSIREIVLPLIITALGFIISITRKNGEITEIKTYKIKQKISKVKKATKKAVKKKTAKKKVAKKKTSKKKKK